MTKVSITAERLRELLNYDPKTGEFRWRVSFANGRHIGDIAGSQTMHGYRAIRINGRCYYEHRLAWLYQMGFWPSGGLDHININRVDNRLSNLRESTQSLNLANSPVRVDNSSGFKGVSWNKRRNKRHAAINAGMRIHLGYFDKPHLAYAAVCLAARKRFGEFARVYEPDQLIIPRKVFEHRVLLNLLAATQCQLEEVA